MANAERLYRHKTLILAKIESVKGTAEAMTATDAVLARDLEITPLAAETLERELIQPYLGHPSHGAVLVKKHAQVSFAVELSTAGTAGTVPAWGHLMRACGMAEAAVTEGTKSVTYTPVGSGYETLTLAVAIDRQKQTLTGCRGTWRLEAGANAIPLLKFEFTGQYADPASAILGTANTGDYKLAEPCGHGNALTLMGNSNLLASTLTYSHAQEIVFNPLIGNTDDNDLPQITDRQPAVQFTALAPDPATLNLIKKAADADIAGGFSLVIGKVAGKVITLVAPKVQLIEPGYDEIDGQLAISATLNCLPTAANNEMSLRLT